MTNVVLTMIVKNEALIIRRCLDAAKNYIHAVAIVDTGSTDSTVDVILDWGVMNNIPVYLEHSQWVNFEINRNESVHAGRTCIEEQGWEPEESYLLFCDADMMLQTLVDIYPTYKVYNVLQYTVGNTLEYYNTRLVRSDVDMHYVGVTHEYLHTPLGETKHQCHFLKFLDLGDGGSKSDKFKRDIQLLSKALVAEPNNARYMFYLANSYYDTGNYVRALEWYSQRAEMINTWEEERWYAAYKYAMSLRRLLKSAKLQGYKEHEDEMVEAFWDAYTQRPTRAEPIYQLALYFAEVNNHAKAYMYATLANTIPYPKQDVLFIDGIAHKNGPTELIATHAYYLGYYLIGEDACRELLYLSPNDERLQKNLEHYTSKRPPT